MTSDRSFFFSHDPRPEEMGDPDDPRPEEMGDPDDPRPEEMGDPDDPRPEEMGDPDDPRPEEMGDPDDPRPEEMGDPDDPTGLGGDARRRRGGRRPCRKRPKRCSTRRRHTFPYQYSGNIVVRLAGHLVLPGDTEESLNALAEREGLGGLARVLERYSLSARRLVDLDEGGKIDPERCNCKGPCECGGRGAIHDLERRAQTSALPPLNSLASYWRIDVSDQPISTAPSPAEMRLNGWEPSHAQTVKAIVRRLNQLAEVDRAYRELAVSDPLAADGNSLSAAQEYLDAAPVGINARWARAQMRGDERGVGLVDLEQGWIAHEDVEADLDPLHGDNRHGEGLYRGHHGTAVLGQIVGLNNDLGVLGITSAVESVRVVSHYSRDRRESLNVANAIRQAIPKMKAGDVLLLEVQRSYLPTEVDDADRDAIRLAVSHGIIVIEAAGNGNADLDLWTDENGERVLDRRSQAFRDSGAIVVGAARAARPHNRLAGRTGVGSNSGSRLDCFAHGDRVVTSGYGDLNDFLGTSGSASAAARRAYTPYFGGTSGAAPIVAGAALLVQALHLDRTGVRLASAEMRDILADPANGTRQGRRVRGHIGTMPDLRKILRERLGLVSDLYLRDRPGDTGRTPIADRKWSSPDIVVMPRGASLPSSSGARPGLAKCVPGDEYSACALVHNRGTDDAGARVRLYRSEVATLVTPAMWEPLDGDAGTAVAAVPSARAGGPAVWSAAVDWKAPATGTRPRERYCFTAVLEEPHRADETVPDPVEPPGHPPYFDWNAYRAFLRSNRTVASSNFHLVDPVADRDSKDRFTLEFAVTGTPDFARSFDFEIVRRLPNDASLSLEAPVALASRIARNRLWHAEGAGDHSARLRLPSVPRLRLERIRLLAGARLPCRFAITGRAFESGQSLAIRQLYRGEEVGRITWEFRG